MTLPAPPEAAQQTPGFLGILALENSHPCLPGDIAHRDAFGVPVSLRTVRGAWPEKVVQSAASLRAGRVLPAFVFVVQAMQRDGARAITTTCGFLVLLQKELQAAVKVPLITSSLLQLPQRLAREPRVGVLTLAARSVGAEHLRAAGVPRERLRDVLVQGVAAGEFVSVMQGGRAALDAGLAGAELVSAALALKQREPALQSLVLEHPAMPAHRLAIEAATGLKTYALNDDERLLRPWAAPRP